MSKQKPQAADALPLPAVEILMDEVRRLNSRIAVPETLYFVRDDGQMSPVHIYLVVGEDDKELLEGRLMDVSDEGLALTVAHDLEIDSRVEVVAMCRNNETELFREPVTVRNCRAARTGLESDTVKSGIRVCGIQSNNIGESPLYKSVLDSIFVEHLCDSKGLSAYLTE